MASFQWPPEAGSSSGVSSLNTLTGDLTLVAGTGITLTPSGSDITIASSSMGGTVTTLSVVSANGLAGTVANPTTTPAITLSTSITGVLKGNGTAISSATAGTDYVIPSGNITGTATNITASSNSTLTTLSNLSLPANQITSTGNLTDAGTDGIVVTGGTGCLLTSASLAQHVADTSHNGYLSSTDWNTFNGKQSTITTGNLTSSPTTNLVVTGGTGAVIGSGVLLTLTGASIVETTSSVLTLSGATNAVLGTGVGITVKQSSTSQSGYLSSTDWNTFNGKQAALSGFTTDGVIYATSSSAIASTSVGTAGQVLTSNGTGVAPTFQNAGTGSPTVFSAYRSTNQTVNSGSLIAFDQVLFDTASGYSTITGKYTVPVTGYYMVTATVSTSTTIGIYLYQNSSPQSYITTGLSEIAGGATIASCTAGDTLAIHCDTTGTIGGGNAPYPTSVSIHLIK